MVLSGFYSWANEQSGHARLGDPRRTRSLVSLATSLAQYAGFSIVTSSHSTAQVEGAYRLICNPSVSPEAIAETTVLGTNTSPKRTQTQQCRLPAYISHRAFRG